MITLISLILLYFLPTIIAREKRDFTGIFLLNLFLGWTLIGWLIALVWACSTEPGLLDEICSCPGRRPVLYPMRNVCEPSSSLLHCLWPNGLILSDRHASQSDRANPLKCDDWNERAKPREEFNKWAEAGRGDGMERDHLPIALPVIQKMQVEATDNVLDAGCGSGWLVRRLAKVAHDGRVVGMDISDEMIRLARRAKPGFR